MSQREEETREEDRGSSLGKGWELPMTHACAPTHKNVRAHTNTVEQEFDLRASPRGPQPQLVLRPCSTCHGIQVWSRPLRSQVGEFPYTYTKCWKFLFAYHNFLLLHSFSLTLFFITLINIYESLLCARHLSRCWKHSGEHKCKFWSYIPVVKTILNCLMEF